MWEGLDVELVPHRPKPSKVSAYIVPIEVTKLEKDLNFPRLLFVSANPRRAWKT